MKNHQLAFGNREQCIRTALGIRELNLDGIFRELFDDSPDVAPTKILMRQIIDQRDDVQVVYVVVYVLIHSGES